MRTQDVVTQTVRQLMAHLGENQGHIGEALNVKRNAVSMRMTGRVEWSVTDIERLAAHWGCETWDVLQGPMVCPQRVIERRGGAVGVRL